ncbi:MAG TPA: PVC-type heme-binding CxxCH protein [Planctomycetota bacterium]|jgi:putative membrane-bound dehydrogenase-like protein|nr:PVC-type heme-binding CxxCH protein [Planctomycetota bacterium]
MKILLAALVLLAQESRPPEATVQGFRLPEGFSAKVFAGEPDVRQPISFCIDDRGRIWVLEGNTYPAWKGPSPELDRVLIFEDTDGDGHFNTRKVFLEGLTYATGIEVGFGGVWIVAPPNLLFYPLNASGDRPAGPPEILLDGFGSQGGHNVVNGFTWGPDGWLYGGHGRTSISDLGPPGTPPEKRIHFDGGVWRYHPTRRTFEAFADGATNPWGVAFDERGQILVSNCVNAHLFHVIQGAHYEPSRERPSSRYAYRRIETIADHLHFDSAGAAGNSALGGGHAHSGALVYLGDSWPEKYRGTFFTSNLHGHRINNDLPVRKGSGFVASHGQDFLLSTDPMFIGLLLQTGPDGSVFLSDWYDRGECHTRDNPDRGTGRIYKIVYGNPDGVHPDLARLSDGELVKLQLHRNEWYVTHSRRLLQERATNGSNPAVRDALRAILRENPDPSRRLRALWALHVTGGLDADARRSLLGHPDEDIRAWTIQMALERRELDPETAQLLAKLAVSDPSPVVRLYLAAGIRRLPPERRIPVLEGLVGHAEDISDPNLPLLIWYAAEGLAEANLPAALALVKNSRIPLLREFMARRISALGVDRPILNVVSLGATGDGTTDDSAAFQKAIDRLATSGGRILVPWGVKPYRIARPLVVSSDHLEFWGPGAQIEFAGDATLTASGIRDLSLRGLRLKGSASGAVLKLAKTDGVVLEDLQVKGGLVMTGVDGASISSCRFDALEIQMAESGHPSAKLRSVTVEKSYRLTGDATEVKVDACRLPSK